MSMGSGSGNNIATEDLIPSWASAYMTEYLTVMSNLSTSDYGTYDGRYPGSITYAPQNSNELTGIANLVTAGTTRHLNVSKGEDYLRASLTAAKLNANTGLLDEAYSKRASAIITTFQEETLPQINQNADYGSDSHHWMQAKAAEAVMATLQDAAMDIYYNDYLMERNSMNSSLGQGIDYGTQDIHIAEILRQAGQFEREYTQGGLADSYNLWKDKNEAVIKRLEIAGNAVRTILASRVENTMPYYMPSEMSQIAGVGLMGLGMYGMIKGGAKNPSTTDTTPTALEAWGSQNPNAEFYKNPSSPYNAFANTWGQKQ